MTSLNTHVPPPHRHITQPPGKQISPAEALSNVQDYLERTRTAPHLHPDALFTESGITFAGSAATGGIALHQLRRVEKGLQGVWLSADLDLEEGGEQEQEEVEDKGLRPNDGTKLDGMISESEQARAGATEEDADMGITGNYQEQLRDIGEGVVEGEVGERNNAVGDNAQEPNVLDTSKSKKRRYDEMETETPVKDKEARKAAKAKRKKEEQIKRQKQREEKNKAVAVDDMDDEDVVVNGNVHDETREEHDDAEPSTLHMPDKISSTVTKTPAEIQADLGLQDASPDGSKKRRKKRKHEGDEARQASYQPEALPKASSPELNSQRKKKKKREEKEKEKEKKDRASSQKESWSSSQTAAHVAPKVTKKAQMNGETSSTPQKPEKQGKREKRNPKENSLSPSWPNDKALSTLKTNDKMVINETPRSKSNGPMIANGELPALENSSDDEGRNKDEDEARALRKAAKRRRKEEKRKAKEAKRALKSQKD